VRRADCFSTYFTSKAMVPMEALPDPERA